MAIDLLRTLAREGQIISIDQIAQKINLDRSVLRVLIQRLQKKGYIERIEKGKYIIIPLNSEQGNYTLQEFVIGSCLVSPYAISYWSALHWYGMTEQIPITVFIQTTARKKKRRLDVFGVDYQIVKIKDENFYAMNGDQITDLQLGGLTNFHLKNKKIATIVSIKLKTNYGIIKTGYTGEILEFQEKHEIPNVLMNSGIYIFNQKIKDFLIGGNIEENAFRKLIKEKSINSFYYDGMWFSVNDKKQLEAAEKIITEFSSILD